MSEDSYTVSSDDVIGAYREKLSEVMHENAILKSQVRKLIRDRGNNQDGQAALQAGR
jgi:hypothetical protein